MYRFPYVETGRLVDQFWNGLIKHTFDLAAGDMI